MRENKNAILRSNFGVAGGRLRCFSCGSDLQKKNEKEP